MATILRRAGATIPGLFLVLALLAGCGRAADTEIVTGQLRAGDLDYWLVGTTLVAIGGAEIGGEKSQLGATVRAEGRRRPDGVFTATRITVGKADPAATGASLPTASVSGVIEMIDPATGRWQIAGRQVQLAPGLTAPGNVAVGAQATAKGFALPDGVLLAAEIVSDRATPAPTAMPTRPMPSPTATQPPPGAPGPSVPPAQQPTEKPEKPEKPAKTKEPRDGPGNGPGNDDEDEGD